MSPIRRTLVLMFIMALAIPLSACGRKGALEAPEDADPKYPRTYPTPEPLKKKAE